MSYRRKWTPSKTKIKEFVNKMIEINSDIAILQKEIAILHKEIAIIEKEKRRRVIEGDICD